MSLGAWPAAPLDARCDVQSIEEEPIASASLAQVHRAVLKDGTKVAVKPGWYQGILRDTKAGEAPRNEDQRELGWVVAKKRRDLECDRWMSKHVKIELI